MSLIKIKNKDEVIEVDRLKYLIWTSNWNGGNWNNNEVIKNPKNFRFFLISNEVFEVDVVVKNIHGEDFDMGNTYQWQSPRVFIKSKNEFGEVLINSLDLQKEYKLAYCLENLDD